MCGRYTVRTSLQQIIDAFSPLTPAIEPSVFTPRYNVAPSQNVLAVRAGSAAPELVSLRWGLVPSWANDPAIGNKMINARSETAATKPAFRSAFRQRRCLVVADGFYEWKKEGKGKQPFFIHMKDDSVFAFAGLWEHWSHDGQNIDSCTVLTTTPNELMEPIHNRMPVIVSRENYSRWLSADAAGVEDLLQPFDATKMEARPVSRTVNSPKNDVPACVESMTEESGGEAMLF